MLLEEGKLLGLTYDAEQNITGWHEHATGGAVESIKVIPDIDGGRDELWMVVRRTINGATVRYLEYMLQEYDSAFITRGMGASAGLYGDIQRCCDNGHFRAGVSGRADGGSRDRRRHARIANGKRRQHHAGLAIICCSRRNQ